MKNIEAHKVQLKDELLISAKCLKELRKLQSEISKVHKGRRFEIFDFGLVTFDKKNEKAFDELMEGCVWHALALKIEFKLKLLYTIDGYLSAVDAQNPISTFLLARYLLELVATVSAIDFALQESMTVSLRDWDRRAMTFFAALYRARHSTSDEKFKLVFAEQAVPAELFHPIKMSKAMRQLTSRRGFETAVSSYHSLSNLCHHNGSGHKMLAENFRLTNVIFTPSGAAIFSSKKALAITINYPVSDFAPNSLAKTARIAWWSALCANNILDEMSEIPFTDRELKKVTRGRIASGRQFYDSATTRRKHASLGNAQKIGRNDLCNCGSGKKFKFCCER